MRHLLLGLVLATSSAFAQKPPVDQAKVDAILSEGLETVMVVVADTSGSMRDRPQAGGWTSKIDISREAVAKFIANLPADIKLGMITFDGCRPRWVAELGKSTNAEIAQRAKEMEARGSTPIHLSLELAYEGVKELRAKNPYARVVVLLITDGEETCSTPYLVGETAAKLAKEKIELQVIGFDLPSQDTELKKIGVKYYLASDSKDLEAGLSSVQGELSIDGGVDSVDGK